MAPDAVDFGSETEREETRCRARSASRQPASPTATGCSQALREEGLDAEPEGEVGIVVPVGGGDGELFHQVEGVVISVGAPFVPIEHEGVIYIRPPVG